MIGGGIGGAMDLAAGAQHVFVTLEHCDSRGRPKLVERCDLPLTMPNCVDAIITDLALLRRASRSRSRGSRSRRSRPGSPSMRCCR